MHRAAVSLRPWPSFPRCQNAQPLLRLPACLPLLTASLCLSGVIGLACARAAAQAGLEVVLLEAEPAIGSITSSRHSEVIHAGIYYPPGSLKARLCVEGKALLYDYCVAKGLAHSRIGKLIVATSDT